MKIMGLDVGSKTVGVAISDALGWTAQGVEIVPINEDEKEFGLARIGELITANDVQLVVIGLPKNMNNTAGPRVKASKRYGKMVRAQFHVPVEFEDERLTTVEAERMLIEKADVSRAKRKKVIDKVAAELILQGYLDRNHG
ncbi:Holliday junction resolvase RuvX [Fructilactobacillus myrtifloralis]|uniref:Putative pre-16S rRNA nuclease n=1 Tax=Fructilactobacillus myrtifloralis TaxID=2940301 RepID=A0ABY5BNC9_9LACO|nr:Holliday junction resolvase RuvX [Fructilactobacillus myrtifloralis]USS85184.1 Holliday junction resolvase RuvX [Fructilactobacillus myrtifloralis]